MKAAVLAAIVLGLAMSLIARLTEIGLTAAN
jgi:hypothetical protein